MFHFAKAAPDRVIVDVGSQNQLRDRYNDFCCPTCELKAQGLHAAASYDSPLMNAETTRSDAGRDREREQRNRKLGESSLQGQFIRVIKSLIYLFPPQVQFSSLPRITYSTLCTYITPSIQLSFQSCSSCWQSVVITNCSRFIKLSSSHSNNKSSIDF